MLVSIATFFVELVNWVIKGLGVVLAFIFSVLPPSPFAVISNSPIAKYLGTLNYFIPISAAITIGEAWLLAIGVYYLYSIIARWIKLIS